MGGYVSLVTLTRVTKALAADEEKTLPGKRNQKITNSLHMSAFFIFLKEMWFFL